MPRLTPTACERASKRDEEYELSDAGTGLRLRVLPSGQRSFILRYRRPDSKKPAKLTLGPYSAGAEPIETPRLGDPLTLQSARMLTEELKRAINRGEDPGAAYKRKPKKVEPGPTDEPTDINLFGPACIAFAQQYVIPKQRSKLSGARVESISLQSTAAECPGSYEAF